MFCLAHVKVGKGAPKRDRADYDGRANDQVPVKARRVHFKLEIIQLIVKLLFRTAACIAQLTSTKVLMEIMEQCSKGEVGIGGSWLSMKNIVFKLIVVTI